jgi:hypothetical protein
MLLLRLQASFTAASAVATAAAYTATAASSTSFSSAIQSQLQQSPALYVCLQIRVPLPQQLVHSLKVPDRNHRVKFIFEELLKRLLYQPLPVTDLCWPGWV